MGASLGHATVASAGAGAPPSYGHDFVTVGAPGNRAALESERYYGSAVSGFPNLGQVNQSFRISRTETTVTQWFDFVRAAWPVAMQQGYSNNDPRFTGGHIYTDSAQSNPNAIWRITPGTQSLATPMSFRFATWYCNWLQAGKPMTGVTLATLTSGAYDANLERQAGAQFWIPSLDEWTKAVYYDPNRYGVGQEGYWLYPGMSQVPLVGGPPGSPGAQTSAGNWLPGGQLPPDVGSYPGVQSPWGLLDTSGGTREYTDSKFQGFDNLRYLRGEALAGGSDMPFDRIDFFFGGGLIDGAGSGFRIASVVPGPASLAGFLGLVFSLRGGRRRNLN